MGLSMGGQPGWGGGGMGGGGTAPVMPVLPQLPTLGQQAQRGGMISAGGGGSTGTYSRPPGWHVGMAETFTPAGGAGAPGGASSSTVSGSPQADQLWQAYQKQLGTVQGAQSQTSPQLTDLYNMWKSRLTADPTNAAIAASTGAIMDTAAGQKNAAMSQAARTGGNPGAASGAIDASAQRAAAGQAGNISLQRQRDINQMTLAGLPIAQSQDLLTLQKQAQTNSLLGMGTGVANLPASIALGQGQLGLSQQALQQQAQEAQVNDMLRLYGYMA
jgi:hypothetical protein